MTDLSYTRHVPFVETALQWMRRSTTTSFKMYSLYHGADARGSQPVLTPIATVYCCFNSHVNREQHSEWRMVLIMTFFPPIMLLKADLTVPHRLPAPNKFAVAIGKMRFGTENNFIINTAVRLASWLQAFKLQWVCGGQRSRESVGLRGR